MRRVSRTPLTGAVVALLVLASTSCGLLIGLDERGRRPDDIGPDGSVPSDANAEGAAVQDPGYCSRRPTLFCDDFDRPGEKPGDSWLGVPAGGVPNVASLGDVTGDITQSTIASSSGPGALEVRATSTGTTADPSHTFYSLLHNVAAPSEARAVELSAELRLLDLVDRREDITPFDGGDPLLWSTPRLVALHVGVIDGLTVQAAQIVISSSYLALALGAADATLPDSFTRVTAFDPSLVESSAVTWLPIAVAIGASDAIVKHATAQGRRVPQCPTTGAVAVVWIRPALPNFSEPLCVALSERLATAVTPLGGKLIGVSAGLGLGDLSTAHVLIDSLELVGLP